MKKMKVCPFCAEEIESTAKICPFCAENLDTENQSEQVKLPQVSNDSESNSGEIKKKRSINIGIANQFKNHLEFLWFDIDDIDENEDLNDARVLLISRHQKRSNLLINVLSEDFILVSARYNYETSLENDKLLDIYSKINIINSSCLVTRWFFSKWEVKDWVMNVEFWMRAYSKIDFAKNLDLMEDEIRANMSQFTDEPNE